MGFPLTKMMKLAKGGLGPDEIVEILSAAGIETDFQIVPASREAFDPLARAAATPGAKVIQLHAKLKDGGTLTALMVLNQPSK